MAVSVKRVITEREARQPSARASHVDGDAQIASEKLEPSTLQVGEEYMVDFERLQGAVQTEKFTKVIFAHFFHVIP